MQAAALARGPRELQLFVGGLLAATLTVPLAGLAVGHGDLHGPVLCPFRAATGLPCPFCGVTRSLFALGQGRLHDSLAFSPIGPLVPLVAGAVAAWVLAGRRRSPPRALLYAATLVLALSWTYQLSRALT